jgi:hypothetical protein
LFIFNFVGFLSPHPANMVRSILTIYTSNDAVLRKEVPFGVLMLPKTSEGSFPPKLLKIGPPIEISLNKSVNKFSTVHAISARISSIGAPCQKKVENLND